MTYPGHKVITRYLPVDWYKHVHGTIAAAEIGRSESLGLREDSRWLSNELEIKTKWGQHDNNVQLAVRIDNVHKWKENLQRTQNDLDREIAMLSMAKEQCERAIQDKAFAEEVMKFCLTTRNKRINFEVVKDSVEDELHKEGKVLVGAKEFLNKKSNDAFEQLCVLQEIRNQIAKDLNDKRTALAIDCDQLHLDQRAINKSFKLNATRLPNGLASYDQWLAYNQFNKQNAEAEMRSSQSLREAVYNAILQSDNDVMGQKEATEFEFRKRMHEMRQIIDEHQWQKKQLEDELANMENMILNLEDSHRCKCNNLKLLETRLENRLCRPNMELCLDDAHKGLINEWNKLKETIDTLVDRIYKTRAKLNEVYATHQLLTDSLRDKLCAQKLDQVCMEERQKLPVTTHKLEDTDHHLHRMGIQQSLPETNWIESATDPSITSGKWNAINANVNQLRTAWELGRTDSDLVSSQLGPSQYFGRSGLYANANLENPKTYS